MNSFFLLVGLVEICLILFDRRNGRSNLSESSPLNWTLTVNRIRQRIIEWIKVASRGGRHYLKCSQLMSSKSQARKNKRQNKHPGKYIEGKKKQQQKSICCNLGKTPYYSESCWNYWSYCFNWFYCNYNISVDGLL